MKLYVKKSFKIHAELVQPRIEAFNFLKGDYRISDDTYCVMITGLEGEKWLTTLAELSQEYNYSNGKSIVSSYIPSKRFEISPKFYSDEIFYAEQTKDVFTLTRNDNSSIYVNKPGCPHGDGDFIVYTIKNGEADKESASIVNGVIFNKMYSLFTEYSNVQRVKRELRNELVDFEDIPMSLTVSSINSIISKAQSEDRLSDFELSIIEDWLEKEYHYIMR